jgi:predicted nucleotidyltransferase component of viral defense system
MEIDKEKLKAFLNSIKDKTNITATELIEKDFYLNILLSKLNFEEYIFKGGTCLAKAYLDYFRFSEDLDFTYLNQEKLKNKSGKQMRKILSKEIEVLGKILESISKKLGLEFKCIKSDNKFIKFGGSNRFVTYKLWYKSVVDESETFIKIQLNFLDISLYSSKKQLLVPLIKKIKDEIELEFPKYNNFTIAKPKLYVYDLKEIAAEKVRALLTRRGFKTRDIVDLYFLSKKGITIKKIKKQASEKILFMLDFEKYGENLKNKVFEEKFNIGDEQSLILSPLGKDFESFANNTLKELNDLVKEVNGLIDKNKGEI